MPTNEAKNTFSKLREAMEDAEVSQTQQELLTRLEYHIHGESEPEPKEPGFLETLEALAEDLELEHPKSAELTRNLIQMLSNIGV